jgi:diaminopimelate decarboxylase
MKGIHAVGVDCHIGSQLTAIEPFEAAVDKLCDVIDRIRGVNIDVKYVDVGGGLGIPYDDEDPPTPTDYGKAVIQRLRDKGVTLIMEPGRVIVGNAGVLVTEVLFRKHTSEKHFLIVDAAMNDLMRPTLYEAYHSVLRVNRPNESDPSTGVEADLVGPICETGDYLARGRLMDPDIKSGELLAVMSSGAYGFSMSSNYNSRPRAAEVLVDGDRFFVVRDRETYEDLVRGERIPPGL